jgi:hypothetical protein
VQAKAAGMAGQMAALREENARLAQLQALLEKTLTVGSAVFHHVFPFSLSSQSMLVSCCCTAECGQQYWEMGTHHTLFMVDQKLNRTAWDSQSSAPGSGLPALPRVCPPAV